ncbi:hypothetical protein JHK82_055363 [Glycine max]|nr:hypothetical protein JHK86_055199 [Glycine max]KAG4917901.1 hypothetical protein JHK85_056182 [Glycine max]KAG5076668.1 hypothetical protein JHK82_055363 [Glycine max]
MSSSNQSKPYTLSFFTAKDPSPGQPFLLRSLKSTIFKKRREKTMSIESLSLFPGILLHFDWIFHTNHATLLQEVRSGANAAEIYSLAFSSTAQYSALSNGLHTFLAQFEAAIDSDFPNYQLETYAVLRSIPNGPNRHVCTTKKKAFYIDSNGLSTSVTTRGGNTVSLNTDIGWRTVFEGRPFYIGCVAQLM